MRFRSPAVSLALLAVIAIVALAACGPGAGTSSAPVATSAAPSLAPTDAPTESATPTASDDESPTGSPATGDVTVMLADSEFGPILTDGEGLTLYGFVPDEASGESTCYDSCEAAWPPLLESDEVTVGEGLDDSDFTLVARTDGTMQVKIGGWPLYYFANDAAPGDTNGQDLNDVWYVVSASGELIGR